MKRYFVNLRKNYQHMVYAENESEAYDKGIFILTKEMINGQIALRVSKGQKVYPCDECKAPATKNELKTVEGKQLCEDCRAIPY